MNSRSEQNTNSTRQGDPVVVNLNSWTTPIVGIFLLVIGLVGGYFAQPLLADVAQPPSSIESTDNSSPSGASASISQAELPSSREELMDFLLRETRHFKGDPNAQVTMIEFSDFQ